MSFDETIEAAERQIEAIVIATQSGWRGTVLLFGGAAPPWRRDQWTTDMIEAIMTRFHEALDDDVLSELRFTPSVYPPVDLGQLYEWKRLGINAAGFDSQIMDPDYFKVICPGRGDKRHWYDAQEAAVELFGRDGGCVSNIVTGIEPMAGLLEGVEERISKGVSCNPMIFYRTGGTPMTGMQPASAEWYQEAFEKINAIRSRYGQPTGDGPGAQGRALGGD